MTIAPARRVFTACRIPADTCVVCELQLTSLPLEILFYFGGLYDIIFFVLTFLLFLYKGEDRRPSRSSGVV